MRTVFRAAVLAVIALSITSAMLPARVLPAAEKRSCCASMKMDHAQKECERHAPKSPQERDCCAWCALGLALLVSSPTEFFYPATGEQSFATLSASAHARSQRPPVPPPRRAAI